MTGSPIDEYLEGVAEPHRSTLLIVRDRIRTILPNSEECITYGLPTWKVAGHSVAGIGAWKNHCSYFPMSGSVLPLLSAEFADYGQSKGALRFAIDTPLTAKQLKLLISTRQAEIATGKR